MSEKVPYWEGNNKNKGCKMLPLPVSLCEWHRGGNLLLGGAT